MIKFLQRFIDAPLPYQEWRPFPDNAVVQIKGISGDSKIGVVKDFWWGYEEELGSIGEDVIIKARRLDKKGSEP